RASPTALYGAARGTAVETVRGVSRGGCTTRRTRRACRHSDRSRRTQRDRAARRSGGSCRTPAAGPSASLRSPAQWRRWPFAARTPSPSACRDRGPCCGVLWITCGQAAAWLLSWYVLPALHGDPSASPSLPRRPDRRQTRRTAPCEQAETV